MPCALWLPLRRRSWFPVLLAATAVFAGCDLPRDPERTLDRARSGTLRVGVSIDEPWTGWEGFLPGGRPVGIEVELAERFAKELDADIEWVRGSESELLTMLEGFKIDLV